MIRQQRQGRRQDKPSRMFGGSCRITRSRRHTRDAGVTVITDRWRMLRRTVVGTIRGTDIHCDSGGGNRLLDARDGMGQTDEQVDESKQYKHRATNARCPSAKSGPAGSVSHTRRLANFEPEYYYNVGNIHQNFRFR